MKIRSLQLKHIGVFEDETIPFPAKKNEEAGAEIHILTGENGTGKTTILQALASGLEDDKYPPQKLLHSLDKRKRANSYSYKYIYFDNPVWFHTHNKLSGIVERNYVQSFVEDTQKNDAKIELLPEKNRKEFEKLVGFSYSGYRFIEHQENIHIKENPNYNPLENALEFDKDYSKNDYTLNQWLAVTIAKRNNAFFENNQPEVERFSRGIENLKQVIEAIIEIPIDFKFKNESSKIVAVKNGQELDFDLLPDGLRSIISWIGDLLMRMDALKWENDTPVFEREFILFLDEIEVHLHPRWQRKILPVVQKLFKNAQIFITTHSPFIVNSVDGAWIYELDLDEKGNSKVTKIRESNTADSYQNIIREIFEVSRFSESLEKELKAFTDDRNDILLKKEVDEQAFLERANKLANKNDEVKNTILFELRQLSTKTEKEFVL